MLHAAEIREPREYGSHKIYLYAPSVSTHALLIEVALTVLLSIAVILRMATVKLSPIRYLSMRVVRGGWLAEHGAKQGKAKSPRGSDHVNRRSRGRRRPVPTRAAWHRWDDAGELGVAVRGAGGKPRRELGLGAAGRSNIESGHSKFARASPQGKLATVASPAHSRTGTSRAGTSHSAAPTHLMWWSASA